MSVNLKCRLTITKFHLNQNLNDVSIKTKTRTKDFFPKLSKEEGEKKKRKKRGGS